MRNAPKIRVRSLGHHLSGSLVVINIAGVDHVTGKRSARRHPMQQAVLALVIKNGDQNARRIFAIEAADIALRAAIGAQARRASTRGSIAQPV